MFDLWNLFSSLLAGLSALAPIEVEPETRN